MLSIMLALEAKTRSINKWWRGPVVAIDTASAVFALAVLRSVDPHPAATGAQVSIAYLTGATSFFMLSCGAQLINFAKHRWSASDEEWQRIIPGNTSTANNRCCLFKCFNALNCFESDDEEQVETDDDNQDHNPVVFAEEVFPNQLTPS